MSSLSGKTKVLVCGYTNVGPFKIQDLYKRTPLHYASSDVAKLLVK